MSVELEKQAERWNLDYAQGRLSLTEFLQRLPRNQQRFFMFGIPTYNNLGDQMIGFAQKLFFQRYFPQLQYIEITEPQTDQAIAELLPEVRSSDMVGFIGGGNIGSYYLNHERARRKVFGTFVNNLTISFPQSVNFAQTAQGQRELGLSQAAYGKNPNLTLCARETQTFRRFQQYFDNNVLFTGDMVMTLDPLPGDVKREGILLVMRHDDEKVTEDDLLAKLTEQLTKMGQEVEQTDTVVPFKAGDGQENDPSKSPLRLNERWQLFTDKLDELRKAKVVITDRLHGMIFSVITQTPCLVFDNSYGKASTSYYNWFEDLNYVQHTTEKDPQKIIQIVKELEQVRRPDRYYFEHSYDGLINLIQDNLVVQQESDIPLKGSSFN
ncbi:general stress protein 30 [Ligilactobacillus salitolerans]|uniref:General stress protein 30 n=1 Tax=Ligilactobacillus salitolerans TaxID=1808352 RepID=A0A401IWH7_9LACO|nr:polysaccharide pyruvyl transferase family protein [Ligilactobacillus salitolerans]GBG95872.1 general stress protein 30 [Ligilactobacillus salitolerans]